MIKKDDFGGSEEIYITRIFLGMVKSKGVSESSKRGNAQKPHGEPIPKKSGKRLAQWANIDAHAASCRRYGWEKIL